MIESIVYNEDCMIGIAKYEDKYFDIAIVDPPYGINAPNMKMGGTKKHLGTATKLRNRLQDGAGKLKDRPFKRIVIDWDNAPPPPEYFKELFRISKQQIIWGGNYFPLPPTRCIICWDKMQPWDNFSQWEMAWTSFDKPAKMYKISTTGGANKEEKICTTQKPVELYDNIYRDFVTKGMKILDTHLGSGSNRITAHKAKVDFIGYEKCKTTYLLQDKRFKLFTGQGSLALKY
jgi:site-specific DNA-methyltransferase (adenine-specific)